jgi:hypothetical protein
MWQSAAEAAEANATSNRKGTDCKTAEYSRNSTIAGWQMNSVLIMSITSIRTRLCALPQPMFSCAGMDRSGSRALAAK